MSELWSAFWFFLPAGVANMSPVLANYLPLLRKWQTPIDFGLKHQGKRLTGDNKSWRGLVFGTFTGALIGLIQYRVIAYSPESTGFIIAVGAAMGFGALAGDAIESFFKRRSGVNPGDGWFPYDQIDYIVGGLFMAWLFVPLTAGEIGRIFVIYFGLHLLVGYIGFLLGIKKSPV